MNWLTVLKSFKSYWKGISIGLLAVALFIAVRSCNDAQKEVEIQKHNVAASLDSVRYYKDKNGDLYAEKLSWIVEQSDLKKYNEQLAANVEALDKELIAAVNARMVIHDTIKLKGDTVEINKTIDEEKYSFPFSDEILKGEMFVLRKLNKLTAESFDYSIHLPIEAYFTKDYAVRLQCNNKSVFLDVQSFIDPSVTNFAKRKRWSLGIYGGLGAQYGLINNKLDIGPQAGVAIGYNLFSW